MALLGLSAFFIFMSAGFLPLVALLWVVFGLYGVLDLINLLRERLEIKASFPETLPIGAEDALRLEIGGSERGVVARIGWPTGFDGVEEAYSQVVSVGQGQYGAQILELPARAVQRGSWVIGPAWLSMRSRFGLFERIFLHDLNMEAVILPDNRPLRSGQIDSMISSNLLGSKSVALQGQGSEFHQLLEFSSGMDPRSIDWKHSARHNKLLSREMRAERNHHIMLVLDNGHLMREEIDGLARIDHSINAAMALGWAALLAGDHVGLFAYDAKPHMFIPPRPDRQVFPILQAHLVDLSYATVQSNITLAMARLSALVPRRSLMIVFTDFVDTTTAELMVENMAMLHRKHAVIFVALRAENPFEHAALAASSEREMALTLASSEMMRERAEVLAKLDAIGLNLIEATPKTLTTKLVSTYLTMKEKGVI